VKDLFVFIGRVQESVEKSLPGFFQLRGLHEKKCKPLKLLDLKIQAIWRQLHMPLQIVSKNTFLIFFQL